MEFTAPKKGLHRSGKYFRLYTLSRIYGNKTKTSIFLRHFVGSVTLPVFPMFIFLFGLPYFNLDIPVTVY